MFVKNIIQQRPLVYSLVFGTLLLTGSACNENTQQATTTTNNTAISNTVRDTLADIKEVGSADSTYLLGVWYDEGIKTPEGANIAYQVITQQQRVFIQPVAFKGEKFQVSDQPVVTPGAAELKRNGNHYTSIESPEDAYEVDKDGNLLIFHEGKLVVSCKKIL